MNRNIKLTQFAKQLRKNQTKAEARLWNKLRAGQLKQIKFRRQQPIGNYIVDFISFEKNLVIELDGGQHKKDSDTDQKRDQWLQGQGFKVLRFWNNEVFENMEGVLETILRECGD